ncbi:MAG: holo-ACP synthase [Sedimentisphaerales bacterium]|jgi:holo-[acyl-carrier protein] synthase
MSKGMLCVLTAVLLLAGCEDKPKYTTEQLATMPFAKRDGLSEPSGGMVLVVGEQTVTEDEVIGPVFEKLARVAQKGDFEQFRGVAEPVIEQQLVARISDALLYSRAKKEAGDINDELDRAVTAEVRKFVMDFGGDYAKAEQALKQMGMDWGEFDRYQRRRVLSQSYISQLIPKDQPIAYSDIIAAYDETKERLYTTPAAVQFRLIDIEPAKLRGIDSGKPRIEQARELAKQLVGRIKQGESFEQLATDYSHGSSASVGGLWRKLDPESLAAPYDVLAKEAAKMKPGEVAGPIESQEHVFIMQLVEYQPKGVEPFEKVQNQVKARLSVERLRQAIDKFNAELLEQASAADRKRFVDFCVREIYLMATKLRPAGLKDGNHRMKIVAHGIDLVDFPRIEEMVARHDKRFLDKVFTAAEQAYAEANRNGVEKLAGRFAAKEAVLKLVGTGWRGKIAWTDIEVVNTATGQPQVRLSGEVKKIADKLGITQISVSITHTANFAIASAVALAK